MDTNSFKAELAKVDNQKTPEQLAEETKELSDLAFMQSVVSTMLDLTVAKRKIRSLDRNHGAQWEVILQMGYGHKTSPEWKACSGVCVTIIAIARPKVISANLEKFIEDTIEYARLVVPRLQLSFSLDVDHKVYTKRLQSGEKRIVKEKYNDDISELTPIIPMHRIESNLLYTVVMTDRLTGKKVSVQQKYANEKITDTNLRARLLLSQLVMSESLVEEYYGAETNDE